jgi:hypothetical protein
MERAFGAVRSEYLSIPDKMRVRGRAALPHSKYFVRIRDIWNSSRKVFLDRYISNIFGWLLKVSTPIPIATPTPMDSGLRYLR